MNHATEFDPLQNFKAALTAYIYFDNENTRNVKMPWNEGKNLQHA